MKHQSSKPIALVVVIVLGIIAIAALFMGHDLIRRLIDHPGDKGDLAVFVGLIGSVFAICTGAIGFVGGVLASTEKPMPSTTVETAGQVNTGGPTVATATTPATPAAAAEPATDEQAEPEGGQ